MKKQICSICKKEYEGYGNNAQPVRDGLCCDECNEKKVLPARLKEANKKPGEVTEAEVKLAKGYFNNMPGRHEVIGMLDNYIGEKKYRIVDMNQDYWQNDEATLVIEMKRSDGDMGTTVGLARFIAEANPDEFHTESKAKSIVMRIWWD